MSEQIHTPIPTTTPSASTALDSVVVDGTKQPLQSGVVLPQPNELGVSTGSLFEAEKPHIYVEPKNIRYKHAFFLSVKITVVVALLLGMFSLAILRKVQDVSNLTPTGQPNISDIGSQGLASNEVLKINVPAQFEKEANVLGALTVKGNVQFDGTINGYTIDELLNQKTSLVPGANGRNGKDGINGNNCGTGICVSLQASTPGVQEFGSLNIAGTVMSSVARFTGLISCGTLTTDTSGNVLCSPGLGVINGFTQGGNSFGATATLGTNDLQALTIKTNGIEAIRINTNGNVGIGTTSPVRELHILSTSGSAGLFKAETNTNSLNAVVELQDSSAGQTRETSLNFLDSSGSANIGQLKFQNDPVAVNRFFALRLSDSTSTSQERLRITSAGNVGIGTTPTYALDVSSATAAVIRVTNPSSSSAAATYVMNDLGDTLGATQYDSAVGSTRWGLSRNRLATIESSGNSPLAIGPNGLQPLILGNNLTEYMRIAVGGNVGIGTNSPGSKLQVDSTASFAAGTTSAYAINDSGNADPGGTTNRRLQTISLTSNGTNAANALAGSEININQNSSGTVASLVGTSTNLNIIGSGSVTNAYGYRTLPLLQSSANLSNYYGFEARTPIVNSTGVLSNAYGLFVGSQKIAGVTTGYGVYQSGASDLNYFGGNVGIGTSSPARALDIVGTGNGAAIRVQDTNSATNDPYIVFKESTGADIGYVDAPKNSGQFRVTASNSNKLALGTSGFVSAITVDTTGNVGIGNSAPSYMLDVTGSGRFTSTVFTTQVDTTTVTGLNIGTSNASALALGNNANNFNIDLYSGAGGIINVATSANTHTLNIANGAAGQVITIGSTNSTSSLLLQSGSGNIALMGGNVGVGTNTLGLAKQVNAISSSATTTFSNAAGVLGLVNTDQTNNNFAYLYFGDDSTGNPASAIGAKIVDHTNKYSDLSFATKDSGGLTDRVTIMSGGNVGIGDTTPTSLLSVGNGHLFQVSSTGSVAAKNSTNSTAAFQVQNAAGTTIFNLDTANSQVSLGSASTGVLGGANAIFSNTYGGSNSKYIAMQVRAGNTTTVNQVSVYVGAVDPVNNQYQVAVYSDNSNSPGTLLATSALATLTSNSWNTVAIPATAITAGSRYWLAYATNTASAAYNNMTYIPNDQFSSYKTTGFSFGSFPASNTFGTTSTDSNAFSIYASSSSTLATNPIVLNSAGEATFSAPANFNDEIRLNGSTQAIRTFNGGSLNLDAGDGGNINLQQYGGTVASFNNYSSSVNEALTISGVSAGNYTSGVLAINGFSGQTQDLVHVNDGSSNTVFKVNATGSTTIQPSSNSTTAFQIQDSGGTKVLGVDTTSSRVSVGSTGNPTGQLYVSGTLPASQTSSVGTSASSWSIFSKGNYIYSITNGTKLEIFDVTLASSPVNISSTTISGMTNANSVYVQGHYAYISDESQSKFYIVDVANAKAPTLTNTVTAPGTTENVVVSGKYAYVMGSNGTIYQYDVSNVNNVPAAIGSVSTGQTAGITVSIFISGNYLYSTANVGGTGKFLIYDISVPGTLTLKNGGVSTTYNNPNNPYIQGRYAYIFNRSTTSNFQIFDISDPTSTSGAVGSVSLTTGDAGGPGSMEEVVVQGRYAYITNTGTNRLEVVDVSNPTSPVLVGSITTGSQPVAVAVNGRYAYVENYGANNIQIFDIGGTYTQALETGNTLSGTLQVNNDVYVGGDTSLQGSLTIGEHLQINGNIGANGSVLFANKSNSTSAFQVQDASGAVILAIDTTTKKLTVKDTVINGVLTVNGHVITGNTSGNTTAAANTAVCGTGCTVTISGNDTSGVITVNTGTGVTAGTLGTITFSSSYGTAPKVILTPGSVPASSTFAQYYYSSTTTTFDIKSYNAITDSKTYSFTYHIEQ